MRKSLLKQLRTTCPPAALLFLLAFALAWSGGMGTGSLSIQKTGGVHAAEPHPDDIHVQAIVVSKDDGSATATFVDYSGAQIDLTTWMKKALP